MRIRKKLFFRLIIILILVSILLFSSSEYSQNNDENKYRLVGGACEGCEAVFDFGEVELFPVDTLPDFNDEGQKIKIMGTIYQSDGKLPAKDVIFYIYHTDQDGIYPIKGNEEGWAKRHGYIRGWIKTGVDGRYTFYTLKPGTYPSRSAPSHIHLVILEPDGKYYWIDEYLFEGDPLLTEDEITDITPRGGGSGIVGLKKDGSLLVGERDIILGKNVPGYN